MSAPSCSSKLSKILEFTIAVAAAVVPIVDRADGLVNCSIVNVPPCFGLSAWVGMVTATLIASAAANAPD